LLFPGIGPADVLLGWAGLQGWQQIHANASLHPFDRRMTSVLDLDPVGRSAAAVGTITALGDDAFPNLQAARNRSGPISPWLEVADENALRSARQQTGQIGLAHGQRQLPQIVTIKRQDVEGVKLDLMVILAGMQPIEIGDAIDAEQDRLAVDHEQGLTVL
jgi:hypothetical protein